MRPILSAIEYGRLLQNCSDDELRPIAAVIAGAAWELIGRHNTHKIVFLCGDPLRRVGQLSVEYLKQSGYEVSFAFLSRDELPDLLENVLICDMLFAPNEDEPLARKRQAWIKAVTAYPCPVFSVAVPAGVDPDSGWADGISVRSEITVAAGAYLRGLFCMTASIIAGRYGRREGRRERERGSSDSKFRMPSACCRPESGRHTRGTPAKPCCALVRRNT